jgi:hypothetical protein
MSIKIFHYCILAKSHPCPRSIEKSCKNQYDNPHAHSNQESQYRLLNVSGAYRGQDGIPSDEMQGEVYREKNFVPRIWIEIRDPNV